MNKSEEMGVVGIHHWVSPKHLDRYAKEMAWRFNRRNDCVTKRRGKWVEV